MTTDDYIVIGILLVWGIFSISLFWEKKGESIADIGRRHKNYEVPKFKNFVDIDRFYQERRKRGK